MNIVYKRIRRFVHHNDYNPPTVLRYGNEIISSPLIVADALGSAFASHSREFSKEFYKARDFEGRTDFSVGNETPENFDYPYNKLFTFDEFKAALSSCGEGAPGPDGIFYFMLRHLHPTTSAFLLDLYRLIFISRTLSSIWRKSIVV